MIKVSIIIPSRNRANQLENTLSSIYNLENGEGIEVIVVDNGSTDDTVSVCKKFAQRHQDFTHYYDGEPGLLTGRHLGALKASGEILCFLDDDVELSPGWLSGVRDAFADDDVCLATGPSIPKYEVTPPGWLQYFWDEAYHGKMCTWLSLLDLGNEVTIIDPVYVFGLNFCIRKNALTTLEGFHPDNIPEHLQMYQGDGETGLTLKAQKLHYKAVYHPGIKLYHVIPSHRLTHEYFKKRAFYQGVCNSFTDLKSTLQNAESRTSISRSLLMSIKKRLRAFEFYTRLYLSTPKEVRSLNFVLREKEKEGYNFHQEAFKSNPNVREWVMRENYWDYKLPR